MATVLEDQGAAPGPDAGESHGSRVRGQANARAALTGQTCSPKREHATRRVVIVNADDLGLIYAFNEGVRRAYQQGCVTSTCLRANGYAYEHAIHEVLPACPGLGVGVHLCLNEADCVAPTETVPLLLGSDGRQRPGFRWLIKLAKTEAGRSQIEAEFRAQIEKVQADGVQIDRLDSHQHVHMIPPIFRITCRLAVEYGIPCVRMVREPAHRAGSWGRKLQPLVNLNYIKHLLLNHYARRNAVVADEFDLLTTDHFVGVNYTGCMDLSTIFAGLDAAGGGSVEVLLHAAIGPDQRDSDCPIAYLHAYVASAARATEVDALTSPQLGDFLSRRGWELANFTAWRLAKERVRPDRSTPWIPNEVRQLCETVAVASPAWVSAAHDDARAFAQLVMSQVQPSERVLDLGTGSGILAICLAKAGHQVMATDLSVAALRNATANAARNEVQFECYQSDLLASLHGRFDLIAFNPPYNFRPDGLVGNLAKNLLRRVPWIRSNSGGGMPRSVLRFHLQLIARLIEQAPKNLNADGAILLHAFESEVEALCSLLPVGAEVELLSHPVLAANRTVGMLIHLPTGG